MFFKLCLLSLFALAVAKPNHLQAAKYPAGVSPHACPNFPFCDNVRLHTPAAAGWQHQAWHGQTNWQHGGHWNLFAPAWHGGHQGHWGAPAAVHGAAAKYPAGVNPHTCPNYPFCDIHAGGGHAHVAPLPGWTERKYPAGVSPHSCPNFPYCH